MGVSECVSECVAVLDSIFLGQEMYVCMSVILKLKANEKKLQRLA